MKISKQWILNNLGLIQNVSLIGALIIILLIVALPFVI